MQKPLILITNDDGDTAPGIQILTQLMQQIGEVVVMAPDGGRSGQSNAITVTQPIRYKKIEESEGLTRYKCTGTPTDCVKLALNNVLGRQPDLIVSGINHGSNAAINIIYSGTMGAVLEGCENGIPSIGFSIVDHSLRADFSYFEDIILKIARETLKNGLPENVCLNVNAPIGEIKGIKVSRQCRGKWVKEFEKRTDPHGKTYFWITGNFENQEPAATDTDEWALANGYVSVVPSTIDLTAHTEIENVKKWNL